MTGADLEGYSGGELGDPTCTGMYKLANTLCILISLLHRPLRMGRLFQENLSEPQELTSKTGYQIYWRPFLPTTSRIASNIFRKSDTRLNVSRCECFHYSTGERVSQTITGRNTGKRGRDRFCHISLFSFSFILPDSTNARGPDSPLQRQLLFTFDCRSSQKQQCFKCICAPPRYSSRSGALYGPCTWR